MTLFRQHFSSSSLTVIKVVSALVLCFSMPLLFSSCEDDLTPAQEKLVFRYNEHANITSLDPAFAKAQRNIWPDNQLYNSLVKLSDSLTISPMLAKSWTIADSGLTYTFHLRQDVYFHKNAVFGKDSTRLMNAQDVVFSLHRLTDPAIASPGSWVMRNVKTITALNDSTVQFKLHQAFPAFLGLLSMTYCSIVPQEMAHLSFRKNPIGTGPFKFKRWAPNEKLVFRRNDLYFETDSLGNQLPYLEAVAITFLPEKQSEFMQFALGNIDYMSGLDASYKDELLTANGKLRKSYRDEVKLKIGPYLNMEYLGIYLDSEQPEAHSQKLRQAMNYGLNRQAMITYLRNGIGVPATHGFIPKGLPAFSNHPYYTYQPQKARALVQAYRDAHHGQQPHIELSTSPQYAELCEFVQSEWGKIGIAVEVNVLPASTLLQQRSSGNLQVFRASWIADYPDAQNYLSLFYSKNFTPNGPNYTHFASAEFDRLYEKALRLPDLKKRLPLYKKMDSIIMTQAAIVPLYYDEVVRFVRKDVHGMGTNPQNLLDLTRVYKK